MNASRRVAVIPTIRDYPWGAPGHCMGHLVDILLEAGHGVLWYVAPIDMQHPDVVRLAAKGAITVRLPDRPQKYVRFAGVRNWMHTLRSEAQSVSAGLDAYRPDHIFINQGGTWCALEEEYLDYITDHAGKYSLICHLNAYSHPFASEQLSKARQIMAGARRVFFASTWTNGLAECKIAKIIPQVVYFQYPIRFRFDSPLPWPGSDVPRLTMVNRLDVYQKGIDIVFESIARLMREGIGVHLGIYGSGSDENYVREYCKFRGIEDLVILHGYTDNIEDVWRREEMLLLPSRFEGLAVSMIEAMGFGRIVLRTPYGGAAEWIEDGINGYICPAPEVDLLTDTLRRALIERANWRTMGLKAHEKIKRQLDPKPGRVFLQALD